MKITTTQLRKIISEEVRTLTEADLGTALSSGSLAGVGTASIKAALAALSDSDFKKLQKAVTDASYDRIASKKKATRKASAAKYTPASLASQIKASLTSGDWDWATPVRNIEAIETAIDSVLGPGAGEYFTDALIYVDSTEDSDVWRKMDPKEADRVYMSYVKKMKDIAAKLEEA